VEDCGLRVEAVGPNHVQERVEVQRAAFDDRMYSELQRRRRGHLCLVGVQPVSRRHRLQQAGLTPGSVRGGRRRASHEVLRPGFRGRAESVPWCRVRLSAISLGGCCARRGDGSAGCAG
jgi:hypothetical protein